MRTHCLNHLENMTTTADALDTDIVSWTLGNEQYDQDKPVSKTPPTSHTHTASYLDC